MATGQRFRGETLSGGFLSIASILLDAPTHLASPSPLTATLPAINVKMPFHIVLLPAFSQRTASSISAVIAALLMMNTDYTIRLYRSTRTGRRLSYFIYLYLYLLVNTR